MVGSMHSQIDKFQNFQGLPLFFQNNSRTFSVFWNSTTFKAGPEFKAGAGTLWKWTWLQFFPSPSPAKMDLSLDSSTASLPSPTSTWYAYVPITSEYGWCYMQWSGKIKELLKIYEQLYDETKHQSGATDKTSCASGDTICHCPTHCMHAAAHLKSIAYTPYACSAWIFMIDRQRLALGGGVETGLVNIHYVVIWTANQSGLMTLTFDLLTLKVVSKSRVTWATSVPILVFPSLSVLDLGPMYATDVRQKHCLMPPPIRGGA